MPDRALIGLTLNHGYYQSGDPGVQVVVPRGMVLRRNGARYAAILPDGDGAPDSVTLTLLWQDVHFGFITSGYEWSAVPVLQVAADQNHVTFGSAPALRQEPRRPGDRRILQMDIEVADGQPREIRLDFETVAAYWTYHVIGRGLRDDLQIVDPDEAVTFDDLGSGTLPNGAPVRVLRSSVPLPVLARPQQHFTLQYEGQFGPVVVIPNLPAAGMKLRPLVGEKTGDALQADIYVTLS